MVDSETVSPFRQVSPEEMSRLHARLRMLEERNRRLGLLGDMMEMLQTCIRSEEAFGLIGSFLQGIFPGVTGALYVKEENRPSLQRVALWGEAAPLPDSVAKEDCWALRRGKMYPEKHTARAVRCAHVDQASPAAYLCIPLIARGEIVGLLHLQDDDRNRLYEEMGNEKFVAVAIADMIALALMNLKLWETLQMQAIRDVLTGLFNRRYLFDILQKELARAARHSGRTVCVLMIDIDHFKRFNDTFGHDAGDHVLVELASYLRSTVRQEDIVCRYGGEELTLIFPGCPLPTGEKRAEDLRLGIRSLGLSHGGSSLGEVAVSVGIAAFPDHARTVEEMLKRADEALYRAKELGRDRIATAG